MRLLRPPLALCCSALLLAACSVTTGENPLTAARYHEELADRLANLVIQADPITKEEGMKEFINGAISDAKDRADSAQAKIAASLAGALIGVNEETIGFAMYDGAMLYFSSEFLTVPGPDLHIYLTQVVDPREVEFPDASALDLGVLRTPYGEQQYSVPEQENPDLYRTLVLWDRKLSRLYGFAQLTRR